MTLDAVSYRSRRFELRDEVAAVLTGHPAIVTALRDEGVASGFVGAYEAASELTILDVDGTAMVRFGRHGIDDDIVVHPESGTVLEVFFVRGHAHQIFVNSSLTEFSATVRALIERLPYYPDGTDDVDDLWEPVAAELLELVRFIDPPAAIPDRYWSTFTDDVSMGDYDTESILADAPYA